MAIRFKVHYVFNDSEEPFVDEVELTPKNPQTGEELPDIPQVRSILANQVVGAIFSNGYFPQEKEGKLHFTPTSRLKDVFVEFSEVNLITDPNAINAVKQNKIHLV